MLTWFGLLKLIAMALGFAIMALLFVALLTWGMLMLGARAHQQAALKRLRQVRPTIPHADVRAAGRIL